MGTNEFPIHENLILDTKIVILCPLEMQIRQCLFWYGGHFEIQDGRHPQCILNSTIEFPIPENLILDTKIAILCALEMKIQQNLFLYGGHFEIQDGRPKILFFCIPPNIPCIIKHW